MGSVASEPPEPAVEVLPNTTAADNLKAAIRIVFALIAALLFLIPGISVLLGAYRTPDFAPNSAQVFLLDGAGAALVAFISAQLGIAVATGGSGFFGRIRSGMGTAAGHFLLVLDVIIFLAVGLAFVFLWVNPESIAVAEGADPLGEAPEYIAMQGRLFVGLVFASLAGLSSSL